MGGSCVDRPGGIEHSQRLALDSLEPTPHIYDRIRTTSSRTFRRCACRQLARRLDLLDAQQRVAQGVVAVRSKHGRTGVALQATRALGTVLLSRAPPGGGGGTRRQTAVAP